MIEGQHGRRNASAPMIGAAAVVRGATTAARYSYHRAEESLSRAVDESARRALGDGGSGPAVPSARSLELLDAVAYALDAEFRL